MVSGEIFDLRPNLVSFWGRTNRGEEEEEGKEKKKPNLRYGTMTMSMESNIE